MGPPPVSRQKVKPRPQILPESLILGIGERGGRTVWEAGGWLLGHPCGPLLCVTPGQPLPLWASAALSSRQGGHSLSALHALPF